MGIKDYFVKKQFEKQLKNLPEQQREMLTYLMEHHSDLMEKIQNEIKERTDTGQDQQLASMAIMKKYQPEIQKALSKK